MATCLQYPGLLLGVHRQIFPFQPNMTQLSRQRTQAGGASLDALGARLLYAGSRLAATLGGGAHALGGGAGSVLGGGHCLACTVGGQAGMAEGTRRILSDVSHCQLSCRPMATFCSVSQYRSG
jgi:hypothetical protein